MILKNGKRLDGCSDTVPIGTINPYIGSIAPYGYLICEGQLVSKTTYKELYEICGDKFGEGTETEFRLPDLRGKTIAGYKEGDTLFGVLGKLIGSENHNHGISHTHEVPGVAHTHTTGNHTLTGDELPTHKHGLRVTLNMTQAAGNERAVVVGGGSAWNISDTYQMTNVGGGGAHSHGDTGSTTPTTTTTTSQSTAISDDASSIQPTVVMNWIVKAFQLMPNQSYVENSLISTSEINSLSAAKGKELNEKFNNYSLLNTTPQTPESNTKISWLQLGYNDRWLLYLKGNTDGIDKDFYIELSETADKKDTGWLPVTFETNYSNYSNYEPCCYRVKGNQIFFKGLVNCGQASAKCGDNICRFDTQYAPTKARYFTVCTSTAETNNTYEHSPAAITVQPSGVIKFHNVPVSGWISLEQITYLLD